MKITNLTLENFGPYEKQSFALGQHNLFIGSNGAGKSSALRAICWALTGACHVTTADGKQSEKLIRTGADQMAVTLAISPHGLIERTKGKKSNLILSWHDGRRLTENDVILRNTLSLPTETLMAMFDPVPILERDAKAQQAAMLRVLRPSQITVPDSLIKEGINVISGIESIEIMIKDRKDGTLRDLNRHAKYLDEHQPELPGDRPRNFDPVERERAYLELEAAHNKLTREMETISHAIGTFEERIRRAEEAGPEPNEEQSQALAKAIAENAENLTAARYTEKSIADKIQIGINNRTAAVTALGGHKTRLENIARRLVEIAAQPKFECPADACPIIKDLAARADTEVQSLASEHATVEAKADTLSAEIEDIETKIEEHQASMQAAIEARARLEQRHAEFRVLAHDAERLAKVHAEAKVARDSLEAAKERLADLRQRAGTASELRTKQGQAMERFREWQAKDEALRKWREEVASTSAAIDKQRRIISDLETLRKTLVGDRSEQFLNIIREFLWPFGITDVNYTFDGGFTVAGRGAEMLSDGQKTMMFEAGFRSAIATLTGADIVVLDDLAPMTDGFRGLISAQLDQTGHQIIECVVSDNPEPWRKLPGTTVIFLSDGAATVSPAA